MTTNRISIELVEKKPNEWFIQMEKGGDSLEVFWKFGTLGKKSFKQALEFLNRLLTINIKQLEEGVAKIEVAPETREALTIQLLKTKEIKQEVENFLA